MPCTHACHRKVKLGSCYYLGSRDTKTDYKEALKWFKLSAEAGNSVAQFALAYAYLQGEVQRKSVPCALWIVYCAAINIELFSARTHRYIPPPAVLCRAVLRALRMLAV